MDVLKHVITNAATVAKISAEDKRLQSRLLTRRQVARWLGVCETTVQRLTRKGVLPALVFNRRLIRYTEEAVETFIAQGLVQ